MAMTPGVQAPTKDATLPRTMKCPGRGQGEQAAAAREQGGKPRQGAGKSQAEFRSGMGRDGWRMRSFWDEKARENPTYYVSSYRPYDEQDWD